MNDQHPSRPGMKATSPTGAAAAQSNPSKHSALWKIASLLLVLLALGLLAWWLTPSATQAPGGRFGGGGPMPVVAATVQTGDMPIIVNGLGTVTPTATVTVQSQVSGQITQIGFKEGQTVKPGDFLIQIDPRPYQVALEQAEGALIRDQALLANAKVDLARYQTLQAQDSIAEQTLAAQKALVQQYEGTVKADQGQVDAAKLNLSYAHIVSPISGRVGLQQVNLGNYVTSSTSTGLAVITQLKPITVVFTLAEDQIPALMKQLGTGNALPVTAYDRTHTNKIATGSLQTIDNQIDTTTGTIKLKATFANDDGSLFPNQFVNVDLLLNTLHDALLIPQSAVQRGTPGTYVYVIDGEDTVSVRKIVLGPGDATNVTVTDGLKAGEKLVIDGADKLKDGAKIRLPQAGADANADATPAPGPGAGKGSAAEGKRRQRQAGDSGPPQGAPPGPPPGPPQ